MNRNEVVGLVRTIIMNAVPISKKEATKVSLEILKELDDIGYDATVENAAQTLMSKDDPNASWNLPK